MTPEDLVYVRDRTRDGLVQSPCLELGAGFGGETCRQLVEAAGMRYVSTDLKAIAPVDVVADFEVEPSALA